MNGAAARKTAKAATRAATLASRTGDRALGLQAHAAAVEAWRAVDALRPLDANERAGYLHMHEGAVATLARRCN